jgi:hypothetical protein
MAGGYNPVTGTVTMTSSGTGFSAAIPLEPTARTTTLLLAGTSNITSTSTQGALGLGVVIQATLDTWLPAGITQSWMNISSLTYQLGSGSTGAVLVDGVLASILGPIAGVRIAITSTTGAPYTFGAAGLTLKSLQSLTAGP